MSEESTSSDPDRPTLLVLALEVGRAGHAQIAIRWIPTGT